MIDKTKTRRNRRKAAAARLDAAIAEIMVALRRVGAASAAELAEVEAARFAAMDSAAVEAMAFILAASAAADAEIAARHGA